MGFFHNLFCNKRCEERSVQCVTPRFDEERKKRNLDAIEEINRINKHYENERIRLDKEAEEEETKKKLLQEMKDAVHKEDNERNLRKHYHPKSVVVINFTDDKYSEEIKCTEEQFCEALDSLSGITLSDKESEFIIFDNCAIRKTTIRTITYIFVEKWTTCWDEHKEPEPFWKDGEIDQRFEEKSE